MSGPPAPETSRRNCQWRGRYLNPPWSLLGRSTQHAALFSRRDLIQSSRPSHPPEPANLVSHALAGRLVALDHDERVAAALFPRQSQSRDVDLVIREDPRDPRDGAGNVLGDHYYSMETSGDLDRIAVDLRNEHASRSER